MTFLDWTTSCGYSSASGMRNALCDAAVDHHRIANYSNHSICQSPSFFLICFLFYFHWKKNYYMNWLYLEILLLTALENGSFYHRIAGSNTSIFTITACLIQPRKEKGLFKFCPCSLLHCFFNAVNNLQTVISLDRKCASNASNFYTASPCKERGFNCC